MEPTQAAVILAIGTAVGLLAGVLGVGGAFVLVPAMHLWAGVPLPLAVGCSVAQALGTYTTSILHRWQAGRLRVHLALVMWGGTLVGLLLGLGFLEWTKGAAARATHSAAARHATAALDATPAPDTAAAPLDAAQATDPTAAALIAARQDTILLWAYLGLLVVIEAVVVAEWWATRGRPQGPRRGWLEGWRVPPLARLPELDGRPFSIPLLAALAVVVGFLTGSLGAGGAILLIPALVFLVGVPTQQAITVTLVLSWLNCLGAAVGHGWHANVDLRIVALLLVGGTVGAKLGAVLGERMHGRRLRGYFSLVILAGMAMVAWRLAALYGLLGTGD